MTLIDQIREMIAEGNTERSLEELYKYVKENNADVIDTLVMLRNRMRGIQDEVSKGTMDSQTAILERAKVNDAILKLLPQLTPEYMAQVAAWKSQPQQTVVPEKTAAPAVPPANKKKWLLIGGGALLLIIILAIAFGGGGDAGYDQDEDVTEFSTDAVPAVNLLDRVMEAHGGHAVWLSDPNEEGQSSAIVLGENGAFQEIQDGQVYAEFQIQEETADYVALYDANRQISLRIFEGEIYFQNPNDPQWYKMGTGQWVTPE